jgi:hypothetical protein
MKTDNKQHTFNNMMSDWRFFGEHMWCPPTQGVQLGASKMWKHLEYGTVIDCDYNREEVHVMEGAEGWTLSFHDLKPNWWKGSFTNADAIPQPDWEWLLSEWQLFNS